MLVASGAILVTKGEAAIVAVTATIVSLGFGGLFTYILRREVKLPHGEGVRMFSLVKMPWHRHPPPYRVVNGKVIANDDLEAAVAAAMIAESPSRQESTELPH